jgi:hypothetical protein
VLGRELETLDAFEEYVFNVGRNGKAMESFEILLPCRGPRLPLFLIFTADRLPLLSCFKGSVLSSGARRSGDTDECREFFWGDLDRLGGTVED